MRLTDNPHKAKIHIQLHSSNMDQPYNQSSTPNNGGVNAVSQNQRIFYNRKRSKNQFNFNPPISKFPNQILQIDKIDKIDKIHKANLVCEIKDREKERKNYYDETSQN